ncbi:hypothetical protein RRG08_022664 [Elysia crispata]|uniref:Uncharacterized protein n=1 Tax=Elysia crispata TaxID=231223 RepID=A0AAE1D932_9GAST|nr:hypothetical protein RRG08_022664 [Elysia crispata]
MVVFTLLCRTTGHSVAVSMVVFTLLGRTSGHSVAVSMVVFTLLCRTTGHSVAVSMVVFTLLCRTTGHSVGVSMVVFTLLCRTTGHSVAVSMVVFTLLCRTTGHSVVVSMVVLQRDGSSHGAHGAREMSGQGGGALTEQRQTASVQHGTSLRPSQSFKDKRSSSAPVKTQPAGQLSAPPQLSHRHSLPTASLFGSPPNTSFLQWQATAMGRFSVLDKAISEETEGDAGSGTAMEPSGGHSSKAKTSPPQVMYASCEFDIKAFLGHFNQLHPKLESKVSF